MVDKIIICAGAPNPALSHLSEVTDQTYLIGVDEGALQLVKAGYRLNVAIGDFDSVTPTQFSKIEAASQAVLKYPAAKDDTDMELGLEFALKQDSRCPVEVYGAIGNGEGRLDHLIANLWLVFQERYFAIIPRLSFIEKDQVVRFFKPGNYFLEDLNNCRYLSIISMTAVKQLQIKQAKYELGLTDYAFPRALVSNEYVDQHKINLSFTEGLLMVIWEKGK
ncbi:thiamine diphosphokinase [Facklamia sp. P12934]|uniref:thiamine diphosphokinase n=1 Tax=unclassified Facklamia TaxID=2622293 RepID=UPI003D17A86B